MKEDLIQFIWRSKILSSNTLTTISGEPVEILHPGNQNSNQGPDFLFARIQINKVLWVGHVEIHINSSDWNLHKHQEDPHYQNTILHVVWHYDKEINWSGRAIPCIEIKQLINNDLMRNYQILMESLQQISCQKFIHPVSQLIKSVQLERMMVERMEEKTEKFKLELEEIQWDWEELLYQKIAHYLVSPVNSDAMNMLCRRLPLSLVSKLNHDTFQMDSAFFGVSGLLANISEDAYPQKLRTEYQYLQAKFKLESMDPFQWKLLRLRPSHFPTIRIAQLSSLLSSRSRLFSTLLDTTKVSEVYKILEASTNDYWNNHFMFNKRSDAVRKTGIGRQTKDILIINAICPLLFAYGNIYKRDSCIERAIGFLQKIKPENNHIIHMWKKFNFVFEHAGHSQGGIQLYQRYCLGKKCTSCSIGNFILQSH